MNGHGTSLRRTAAFAVAYAAGFAALLFPAVYGAGLLQAGTYVSPPPAPWPPGAAWNPIPGGGAPVSWAGAAAEPFLLLRAPFATVLGAGTADAAFLVAALAAAATGAATLVAGRRGRAFAAVFGALFACNPLTGGWIWAGAFPALAGWALLPWLGILFLNGRRRGRALVPDAIGFTALLALCPPLAGGAALAAFAFGPECGFARGALAGGFAFAVAVNAFWVIPALAAGGSPPPQWWPAAGPSPGWAGALAVASAALLLAATRFLPGRSYVWAAAVALAVYALTWRVGASSPLPHRVALPDGFAGVSAALAREPGGGLTLWLPGRGDASGAIARWSRSPVLNGAEPGRIDATIEGAAAAGNVGSALAAAGVRFVAVAGAGLELREKALAAAVARRWAPVATDGTATAYRNPAWRADTVSGPSLTLVTGNLARLVGTAQPSPVPLVAAGPLSAPDPPAAEIIDPALHVDRFLRTAFASQPVTGRLSPKGRFLFQGSATVAPGAPLLVRTERQREEPLLVVDSDIARAALVVKVDGKPVEVYEQLVATPHRRHAVMFPAGNGARTVSIGTAQGPATVYGVAEISARALGEARSRTLDALVGRDVTFVYDAAELVVRTAPDAVHVAPFAIDAVRFGSRPWTFTVNGAGLRTATVEATSWHGDRVSRGAQRLRCVSAARCTGTVVLVHHGYADQLANGGDDMSIALNAGARIDSFVARQRGAVAPNAWRGGPPDRLRAHEYLETQTRFDPGWALRCADRTIAPFETAAGSLAFVALRPAAGCALRYLPAGARRLGWEVTLFALAAGTAAAFGYRLRKRRPGAAAAGNLWSSQE